MVDLLSLKEFRAIFKQTNAGIALVKRLIRDTMPRHYENLVLLTSLLIEEN